MEKKLITNELLGESYTHIKHPSGLNILVWEMEGFSSVEAYFGTKYGSINTMFKTSEDKEYTRVPEGIAHFLEHKLFENEESDVFELYAKTGASANAYTSFDTTAYLFTCTDNYKESLDILLSFVQSPYFTKESVDKEQGIIGQEIKMTDDNPYWRVFFNLLKAMYHNHPVKIDIAGTVESISKIDAELLYKCYNTFYNLNNMVLAVAGNVTVDGVLEIADKRLKQCRDVKLETFFPDEPVDVVEKEVTGSLPVGMPLFNIGIKCKPESGYALLKAETECYIAANILSDASSDLYKSMMDEGLINTSFSNEIFVGGGYFAIIFSGESEKPNEVLARIKAEIERAKAEGLDRDIFEGIKKSTYGSNIRDLNNVEAVASSVLLNSYFEGVTAFDSIKVLSEITYEDVQKCLCERFDTDKISISIIK